jgi:hypothetical protein
MLHIEGSAIHNLDKLADPKDYVVIIENSIFRYNNAQSLFLSKKALEHFKDSLTPFRIEEPIQSDPDPSFSFKDLLKFYHQYDSLFRSSPSLTIDFSNKNTFQFIGDAFENPSLLSKVNQVTDTNSEEYHLISEVFATIPYPQLREHHDFFFTLNNKEISVSFLLLSQVCQTFYLLNHQDKVEVIIPSKFNPYTVSFFKIFEGIPFKFKDHKTSSNIFLIHFFGITFPRSLISNHIPLPETLSDSIQYLSMKGCQSLEDHFN